MLPADSPPLLTLNDEHGAPLAEIIYYPDTEVLGARWHGHLTGAEVVRGAQMEAGLRSQLHHYRLLNDKRDTSGDWSDALPWLQYEWLPQAVTDGIRAMAYVFSPERENRFVSQEFILAVRPYMAIEVFDNPNRAYAWLLQQ
jgi:hypothetical protein